MLRFSDSAIRFSLVTLAGGLLAASHAFATVGADGYRLEAVWNNAGAETPLKSWSLEELGRLKSSASREKDPASGKMSQWQGVLLKEVVDNAMSGMTPERKAQIDLVILKNGSGAQALLPRAFISKYPVLLALKRDRRDLGQLGPVYSVMPWTSKAKITQEDLPIEKFFLSGLKRIEFANYRERYGSFFLRRRTDPVAMRGEKLFMQNCVACHDSGLGPSLNALTAGQKSRTLASDGHPPARGVSKWGERERRSLMSYLDAYRSENPGLVGAK